MHPSIDNSNQWRPLDMRPMLKNMIRLKFSCLHCLKFKPNNMQVDYSDILGRFTELGIKHEISRTPKKKKMNYEYNVNQ